MSFKLVVSNSLISLCGLADLEKPLGKSFFAIGKSNILLFGNSLNCGLKLKPFFIIIDKWSPCVWKTSYLTLLENKFFPWYTCFWHGGNHQPNLLKLPSGLEWNFTDIIASVGYLFGCKLLADLQQMPSSGSNAWFHRKVFHLQLTFVGFRTKNPGFHWFFSQKLKHFVPFLESSARRRDTVSFFEYRISRGVFYKIELWMWRTSIEKIVRPTILAFCWNPPS